MTTPYEALTHGHAFVEFDKLSVLQLTGKDRLTVLNNLCTNDIKKLAIDRGCETFITDVRGRVIGHVCAFHLSEELLLIGSPGQAETLAAHIDRYVIREDVAIQDCSDDVIGWLLSGCVKTSEIIGDKVESLPYLSSGMIPGMPSSTRWFQLPWTSQNDCLVLGNREHTQTINEWFTQHKLAKSNLDAYQLARIEAHWPEFGIDCSDANLPQEIDRNEHAISFTKGCYLGQETVARLDALGQVQKKLVRMRISGQAVPVVGTQLVEAEKPCGEVRSAVWSPHEEGIIALGYVRRKWFDSGSRLQITGTDQMATVL